MRATCPAHLILLDLINQVLVYADYFKLLRENINAPKEKPVIKNSEM
jgi:hypothetical protein